MKVFAHSITSLSSEGYITLQVPEFIVNIGGGELPKQVEEPDEWFIRLSNNLPSRQGFLFLSRAGWEANKDALWGAFEPVKHLRFPGITRQVYEDQIEKELTTRETAVRKKIASLRRKIGELESCKL